MKKQFFLLVLLLGTVARSFSQSIDEIIQTKDVERLLQTLSADDMQGRGVGTAGIDKAAAFIADGFKEAGLQPVNGSYFQEFAIAQKKNSKQDSLRLRNVIGILPGKSRASEIVIFSAHYDHLGIGKPTAAGDSIYNGANDDASGTAAIMALASYFAKQNNNERTVVFAAFTAEEMGLVGSTYFSKQYDPSTVVAMFNIEMIGTESKWGRGSAFITGYDKSDMGKILSGNLSGSQFKFYPDPYPKYNLFYRSDNATLARQGVPAHTISTCKMDSEKYYHTADDEIETLDMENMVNIIKAIALSASSIVAGDVTPSRVDPSTVR
jgi:Zn-dependent M28 family amino/carboxypeptidase